MTRPAVQTEQKIKGQISGLMQYKFQNNNQGTVFIGLNGKPKQNMRLLAVKFFQTKPDSKN